MVALALLPVTVAAAILRQPPGALQPATRRLNTVKAVLHDPEALMSTVGVAASTAATFFGQAAEATKSGMEYAAPVLKAGASVAGAGFDITRAAVEIAAPVVKSGVTAAAPVVKAGIEAAAPEVERVTNAAVEAGQQQPAVQAAFHAAGQLNEQALSTFTPERRAELEAASRAAASGFGTTANLMGQAAQVTKAGFELVVPVVNAAGSVAKAGVDVAVPVVKAGVSVAAPIVKAGIDAAAPEVEKAARAAMENGGALLN